MDGFIIHVVRRFEPFGGMETYVWQLVHGLCRKGFDVAVVCEHCDDSVDTKIRIVKVHKSRERPRWKAMIAFRENVNQVIRERFVGIPVVVHSHERSLCHHITTFHGPPIDPPFGARWLVGFHRRYKSWKRMEEEELLGDRIKMIIPVSSVIEKQLLERYPSIQNKSVAVVWPGVHKNPASRAQSCAEEPEYSRFVFVGKEWKRKGLDLAVRIVREYRQSYKPAVLTIYGVPPESLPYRFKSLSWISIEGWSDNIRWDAFDILLHPARREPFGMVVAEARNNGLPVLMSNNVGAADLHFQNTAILDMQSSLKAWSDAAAKLITEGNYVSECKWTWEDLVNKHCKVIYPKVGLQSL